MGGLLDYISAYGKKNPLYGMNKTLMKEGKSFLFGEDPYLQKFETMSPEQKGLFGEQTGALQGGYGQAMDVLRQFLDPSSQAYQSFADPYMREFEQQTIPGLAERFAGAGAQGGALSSSGFGQALSSAGSNLQSNLVSMKTGLMRQSAGDIFGEYNRALGQQPFGYTQNPGKQGMAAQLIAALVKAFAGGGGGF